MSTTADRCDNCKRPIAPDRGPAPGCCYVGSGNDGMDAIERERDCMEARALAAESESARLTQERDEARELADHLDEIVRKNLRAEPVCSWCGTALPVEVGEAALLAAAKAHAAQCAENPIARERDAALATVAAVRGIVGRLVEMRAMATPGPWRVGSVETWHMYVPHPEGLAGPSGERVLLRFNEHFPHAADAALICAAVNSIAALDAATTGKGENNG